MKQQLLIPVDIEGRLKIELFDADTGKLQDRIEADNYVTDQLIASIRWIARRLLSSRIAITSPSSPTTTQAADTTVTDANATVQAGQNTDYSLNLGPGGVLLSDDAHPENTNDRILRGNVIAWSDVYPFSGTDLKRGQQNANESVCTPTYSRFVFDWPTSAGNGTIASVYWFSPSYNGTTSSISVSIPALYTLPVVSGGTAPAGSSITQGYGSTWGESYTGLPAGSTSRGMVLDADGVSYWTLNTTVSGSTLVKRTLTTGVIVAGPITLSAGLFNSQSGLAYDGTKFWAGDNTNIRRFNSAGTVDLTYATSGRASTVYGPWLMQFVGGYLWFWDSTASLYKQMDPANGNIVASIPLGTLSGQAVAGSGGAAFVANDGYNADEFWIVFQGNFNIGVYSTTGVLKRSLQGSGDSNTCGMAIGPGETLYQLTGSGSSTGYVNKHNTYRFMHARALLGSPVTKANTQTMKLTYEFDYS